MSNYFEEFDNKQDVEEQFDIKLADDIEILLAWYDTGNYEGQAFVLFRLDGKLFEVNGSHCSCDGLEGQWEPEETNYKALKMRKLFRKGSPEGELLDIILIGLRVDEEGA